MGLFNDVFGGSAEKKLAIAKSKDWTNYLYSVEAQVKEVANSIDGVLKMQQSFLLSKEMIEKVWQNISYQEHQVFMLRSMNEQMQKDGRVITSFARANDYRLEKVQLNMIRKVEQFNIVAEEKVADWPIIREKISTEMKLSAKAQLYRTWGLIYPGPFWN
jgi:hypothetical protein